MQGEPHTSCRRRVVNDPWTAREVDAKKIGANQRTGEMRSWMMIDRGGEIARGRETGRAAMIETGIDIIDRDMMRGTGTVIDETTVVTGTVVDWITRASDLETETETGTETEIEIGAKTDVDLVAAKTGTGGPTTHLVSKEEVLRGVSSVKVTVIGNHNMIAMVN